jgi:hypothetical protein
LDDSIITKDLSTNTGVVAQEKSPIHLPPEQGYNVSQQEIIAMNKEMNASNDDLLKNK